MGGRPWTSEEIEFLKENTDSMLVKDIMKELGRSKAAVLCEMERLGIRGFVASTDLLTQKKVCEIMGVTSRTVHRWERYGLRVKKIGHLRVIRQDKLISFLGKHPDLWNANRVKDNTILTATRTATRAVYASKKLDDQKRPYKWTPTEKQRLKHLYDMGLTYSEMARIMGRSRGACSYQMRMMSDAGIVELNRESPIKACRGKRDGKGNRQGTEKWANH